MKLIKLFFKFIVSNNFKTDYRLVLIFMTETISITDEAVNPDRNIFSINVELTSTFFTLQRLGPSPSPSLK